MPAYAGHLRAGRAVGSAVPRLAHEKGATALIDAGSGLAYPACAMAVAEGIRRSGEYGVSFVGVGNSHHFGAAAYHLEAVAEAELVGLALSNSPAAMPAWGGKRPLFGTNPIAAVFPRRRGAPLLMDLSLAEVARGKLMIAARDGKSIPEAGRWTPTASPPPTPRRGWPAACCRPAASRAPCWP